jgi:hypothetical protein
MLSEYQFGENKGLEGLATNRFTIHVGDIGKLPDLQAKSPLQYMKPLPYEKTGSRTSRLYLVDNEAEPKDFTIRHTNKSHDEGTIARKLHGAVDAGNMAPNFIFSSPNAKKDSNRIPNPNSNHPQMKAYIDYSYTGPNSIFIHMMRSEQKGYHHTRNLAAKLSEMHPGYAIDFGKMKNEHISAIKDEMAARGHEVSGQKDY